MSIDMQMFQSYSPEDKNQEKARWQKRFQDAENQFALIEKKVKTAMLDDTARHADLSPLLSYRQEIKQECEQARKVLEWIERILGGEEPRSTPSASSTFGAGVVNIRADDTRSQTIPGAKTFAEILKGREPRCDDKEQSKHIDVKTIEQIVTNVLEVKKNEERRKQSQPNKTN